MHRCRQQREPEGRRRRASATRCSAGASNGDLMWESVVRAERGEAARHAHDQEPRARQRRRQEAVAAEGHGPRPRRIRAGTPLWRHGGTVFGPQPRSYEYQLPKKVERGALRAALASKMQRRRGGRRRRARVDRGKTKSAAEMLKRARRDRADAHRRRRARRELCRVRRAIIAGVSLVAERPVDGARRRWTRQRRHSTTRGALRAVAGGARDETHEVIRRPLVTEKTSIAPRRRHGRSCSRWRPSATKIDIKRAIEKLLGSKVGAVRTSIIARQGQAPGAFRRPTVGLEEGLGHG